MKKRIVIRTEGGAEKGLGHIFRCIALAEMLSGQYEIIFLSNYITPAIKELLNGIASSYFQVPDYAGAESCWQELSGKLLKSDIVVFDAYCFGTDIQRLVKNAGHPLVCVDDIHAFPFVADAVINHAGGFTKDDYTLAAYTKLYTGPEYALLRRPFREAAAVKKQVQPNNECLICFGGADPANDTLKTLDMLVHRHPELHFHVVTGNAYRFETSLEQYRQAQNVHFHSNLDATRLCGLMQQCHIAVSPPSTTAYEYLSVKGTLYLKVIADNQQRMFSYLTQSRLALPIESFGEEMGTTALHSVFDGQQQQRLLDIFNDLPAGG